MNFEETIAAIDAELTPQRVIAFWTAALEQGFQPTSRCAALIFPSAAAMLETVCAANAANENHIDDHMVVQAWPENRMRAAFAKNVRTLQAYDQRPNALLIATAVRLESGQLYTMSITCVNPR
jgi:hypothetical protein